VLLICTEKPVSWWTSLAETAVRLARPRHVERRRFEVLVDKTVYLIGALANNRLPHVANLIRKKIGCEVFDDWWAPGPYADAYLRDYAHKRGLSYKEVLHTYAAKHIFEFDKGHLDCSHAAVLVMPAGKSGHLELGYFIGTGKPGFVLFDKTPKRVDLMYQFATDLFFSENEMIEGLRYALR